MSEETAVSPPPTSSNKMLLIVMLAFNVLIAGGLAYQVVMGQLSHAAAAKGAVAHDEHKKPTEKFGPIIDIGSLVANLGGPGAGHYVKVTLHVETANEESKKLVEGALVPLRNETLLFLGSVDAKQLSAPDRLRTMSTDLKEKFGALVGKETVRRVYFSEFVIQ
jgi:flagellar FliL protein